MSWSDDTLPQERPRQESEDAEASVGTSPWTSEPPLNELPSSNVFDSRTRPIPLETPALFGARAA